jgi:hypothetical protein
MEKKRLSILYLSVTAFLMEWVSAALDLSLLVDFSRTLNIVFFLVVVFSLIREMATAKVVTARVIMASVTGYLLLGILSSVLVNWILRHDPTAFRFSTSFAGSANPILPMSDSIYFGFVTLATLGYGDFVPLKPYTRSLATLIAVSGQLYIATIIGVLIGKFVASKETLEK